MGKRLWNGVITAPPLVIRLGTLLLMALFLAGCGHSGVERVDVTWQTDPPPKWGLYPGYRQEIPCPVGAAYRVEMISKGAVIAGGTLRTYGNSTQFMPGKGARIETQDIGGRLALVVVLPSDNGDTVRQTAIFITKDADKIIFEVPK